VARHADPASCVWPYILLGNVKGLHDFSAIPNVIGQQSLSRVGFLMSPPKLSLSVRLSSGLTKKPTREK
jgi:hypothetical protein